MCGIIGSFEPVRRDEGRPWSRAERRRMADARDLMASRGPDGAGLWHDDRVLLGHRRLSILDLSDAAAQPMVGRTGAVLTFNGELYNYLELRAELAAVGVEVDSTGDTAVLLAAYERWGLAETLRRVRGMFAFAIWDPRSGQLHLARDPVGKKPLYVADDRGRFAFASSLASLRRWLARGRELAVDPVAVEHLLVGGYIPAPRTIYKGVRKLAAGTWLTVDADATLRFGRHYRPPLGERRERLGAAILERLDELLLHAVRRRLRSDVPVATFLSGGLDSSLVTACAARLQPGITAYTVRTDDGNDDEFGLARAIAAHTGVRHRIVSLPPLTPDLAAEVVRAWPEPLGDSSALPSWMVARLAAEDFRVVLTGDGGDEVQGGYGSARMFALRRLLRWGLGGASLDRPLLAASGWSGRPGGVAFKLARVLTSPGAAASMRRDRLDATVRDLIHPDHRAAVAHDGWTATWVARFMAAPTRDELDRMLAADFTIYLPDDLCVKVDGASMAHGLEARSPLLDRDFVDASWAVRSADRSRPWASKRIVRALFARHLPVRLLMRRKQGFSIPIHRTLHPGLVGERLRQADRGELPLLSGVFAPGALSPLLHAPGLEGPDAGMLLWRLWWLCEWAASVDGA